MYVFLLVLLAAAAAVEALSLRGRTQHIVRELSLSETRVEPGAPFALTTRLENQSWMPVTYLSVTVSMPLGTVCPAAAKVTAHQRDLRWKDLYRLRWYQRKTHTLPLTLERRGVHSFIITELEQGDFLGLNTSVAPASLSRELMVYPTRLESAALTEALGSFCGELSARRWLIRDPILTLGVREYTGHEPMNTISWSQTARRGELTVREFDYTRSLSCSVILAVNGIAYNEDALMDRCCAAVRSICEQLAARGVAPSLTLNARLSGYPEATVRRISGESGRMQDILEALSRAMAMPVSSWDGLIASCLSAEVEDAAYLLVVPRRSAEAEELLEVLRMRTGAAVSLIAVEELEDAP